MKTISLVLAMMAAMMLLTMPAMAASPAYNAGYAEGHPEGFIDGHADNIHTYAGINNPYPYSWWHLSNYQQYKSGYHNGYDTGYQNGIDAWYLEGKSQGEYNGFNDGFAGIAANHGGIVYPTALPLGHYTIFLSGYVNGYNTHHPLGVSAGEEYWTTEGTSAGYDPGHADGLAGLPINHVTDIPTECPAVFEDEYQTAYNAEYDVGHADGITYGEAYWSGIGDFDGYAPGYADGIAGDEHDDSCTAPTECPTEFVDNYAEGYAATYDTGYNDGVSAGELYWNTQGDADGYNPGYAEGYAGDDRATSCDFPVDCPTKFEPDYEDGFADTYNQGFDDGRDDAESDWHDLGYDNGEAQGITDGMAGTTPNNVGTPPGDCPDRFVDEYLEGYAEGYDDGYVTGTSITLEELWTGSGTDDGYPVGYSDGYNGNTSDNSVNTYPDGCNTEEERGYYKDGYEAGYDNGYADGVAKAAEEAQQVIDDAKQACYDTGYDYGYDIGIANGTLPDCECPENCEYPEEYCSGITNGYNAGITEFLRLEAITEEEKWFDAGYDITYPIGLADGTANLSMRPEPDSIDYPPECDEEYHDDYLDGLRTGYVEGYEAGLLVHDGILPEVELPKVKEDEPSRTLASPYLGPNRKESWRGYEPGDWIPTLYTYWLNENGAEYETAFEFPASGTYYGGVHVTPPRVMGRTIIPMNELDETAKALRIAQWYENHE